MADIDKINGIDEDDISHYNGGEAALYTSLNSDTWVHTVFHGYGSIAGFCSGGPNNSNTIEKFPLPQTVRV